MIPERYLAMKAQSLAVVITVTVTLSGCSSSSTRQDQEFSPYVATDGTITVPANYRTEFAALGTWSIAAGTEGGEAAEHHVVYTPQEVVAEYRATGTFPDGAVIVKELFSTETEDMTTGHVSRESETIGWFVMVKDAQNRFPDNPLWGEGWGWAYFEAADPSATISTDYQQDCRTCHVPAQQTDWIYVQGYPTLWE